MVGFLKCTKVIALLWVTCFNKCTQRAHIYWIVLCAMPCYCVCFNSCYVIKCGKIDKWRQLYSNEWRYKSEDWHVLEFWSLNYVWFLERNYKNALKCLSAFQSSCVKLKVSGPNKMHHFMLSEPIKAFLNFWLERFCRSFNVTALTEEEFQDKSWNYRRNCNHMTCNFMFKMFFKMYKII